MWAVILMGFAGVGFALVGGFLYFDLSGRLSAIEEADDAPHNIIKMVEESHSMNRDNEDQLRRHGQRIDDLEERKLTIQDSARRL